MKVTGEATVGTMIGTVGGDVGSGVEQTVIATEVNEDLARRLDDLLAAIAEAHATGRIDDDTVADATEEVNNARADLPVTDEKTRNRVVRTMKKVGALLEGLAELTSKVAGAIAAAKGLL